MTLDIQIEALLFYKATPQKKTNICKLFSVTEEVLSESLEKLKFRLQNGATRLIETDTEIQMVTAPELAEFVESLRKQELSSDIGKAGAETLSIILYR
jgi:chromosome segregation and condensation protein ScpB